MSVMANEAADRREVRWSANRKTDVVLRLLRGEKLDTLDERSPASPGAMSAQPLGFEGFR